MKSTKYVMVWEAYAEWKGTRPFDTLKAAEKHRDQFIKDNAAFNRDYNRHIQIIPIEVDTEA